MTAQQIRQLLEMMTDIRASLRHIEEMVKRLTEAKEGNAGRAG